MAAATPRTIPKTIVAIDLLRFACAMLVLGYHYSAAFWAAPDGRVAVALQGVGAVAPAPLARAGLVGVELFFVISGLVIATSAANAHWRDFLARRALRLVPAAWICASLTAIVLAANGQMDATLIADWFRSVRFWPVGAQIDGSYWTLGVECAFYLLIAAAAGVGNAKRIVTVGWVLAAASALFWATCLVGGDSADMLITNQAAILLLLPHGCFFAVGIALAVPHARGSRALLLIGAGTGLVEIAAHIDGWQLGGTVVLAELLFCIGLTVLALSHRMQAGLMRLIDPRIARSIGLMTYPLYLLHQIIGAVLIGVVVRSGLPVTAAIVLTMLAMLASAWAVAHHAEPALRRGLVWLFSPRRGPPRDSLRTAFPPTG